MAELDDLDVAAGTVEVISDASGACVLKLSGEIDASNVESLLLAIEPVVQSAPERVIFDLGDLDFMDSSGIALLLRVASAAQSVQLHEPSSTMRRIIEATGLTHVLPIDE